jgi:aryl-alcohol dehydrogenase-like predicted oxidoreductase
MEIRRLGQSDLEISVMTLGGWMFGVDSWSNVNDDDSIRTIHAAIDAGITMVDTALGYGGGYSESIIGKALKMKPGRLLISSKCSADPKQIPQQADAALSRLQVDCIDVYHVHYPSPRIPIAETIGAMSKLVASGKIRYIGVSNFSVEQMEEGLKTARIECCQPPLNLFWRVAEEAILPFCQKHQIGVICYSPLAQGLLTGRFRRREDIPDDIRSRNKLFREGTFERCLEVLDFMQTTTDKHGKSLTQVALNWVVQQPQVTSAIVGAQNPAELKHDVESFDWKLSSEELKALGERGLQISKTMDFDTNMWGYKPS